MASGTMRVRNACSFPVTFYALAGPTLEIPSGRTSSAGACLIWFSTRAKGPGDVMNTGTFEALRDEYVEQFGNDGHDAYDYQDGGSGAAAGSILGIAVGALEGVFKVKSTSDNGTMYIGAKKEGVYGNSNLVVYATLDKACLVDPKLKPIWYLHLESDHGQYPDGPNMDPAYTVPDLAQYADTVFVRARNKYYGTYLYAQAGDENVGAHWVDIPYNPLTMREYWSVHPLGNADAMHNVKVLNTAVNKWLTCFTSGGNRIGLLSLNYQDYLDQHWDVTETSSDPETIKLANLANGKNLVARDGDGTFIYQNLDSSDDQKWVIETCTVDIHKIPPGKSFRIMQASTGRFICAVGANYPNAGNVGLMSTGGMFDIEESIGAYDAHFVLEPTGTADEYRIKCSRAERRLAYILDPAFAGLYATDSYDGANQYWTFRLLSNYAGFHIVSRQNGNSLFHDGQRFGLYWEDYPDQVWVAVV